MSGFMVLVDTAVFIAHFRGKSDDTFKRLLFGDEIFLSPFVRIELLQGVKKSEASLVEQVLGGLVPIPAIGDLFGEAEMILRRARQQGMVLGIIDLLIAAQANLNRCPVYSFDKVFDQLALFKLVAVL